jgi:hypothetical protein
VEACAAQRNATPKFRSEAATLGLGGLIDVWQLRRTKGHEKLILCFKDSRNTSAICLGQRLRAQADHRAEAPMIVGPPA